jgi:hypothetical protein
MTLPQELIRAKRDGQVLTDAQGQAFAGPGDGREDRQRGRHGRRQQASLRGGGDASQLSCGILVAAPLLTS